MVGICGSRGDGVGKGESGDWRLDRAWCPDIQVGVLPIKQ